MTARKPADSLIGARLGDYAIQELIGRGGMARVYRGLDENLGRPAAIKVVEITPDEKEKEDERIIERFKLEARAIASFDHPNIITIYQYGETPTQFFIAMKLIQGETLGQVMRLARRSGQLIPTERVLSIVHDVCAALDYAHARGIIHRDIKPSNILFDANANNRAILTDFGLAMKLGGASTMGTAFGTPRYIAPEQAVSSQKAVPQTDIYSLAVVVFEMLTGQVPFQDESPMSIALYHITSEPPRPRSLNPQIPQAVEDVILRALAKEPERRYQTAGDFARALAAAYQEAGAAPAADRDRASARDGASVPEAAPASPPAEAPSVPTHTPSERKPEKSTLQFRETGPDAPMEQAAPASAPAVRRAKRRRVGVIPAIALLLIVVGGIVGFWLINGQSLALPRPIQDVVQGVFSHIGQIGQAQPENAPETENEAGGSVVATDTLTIPPDAVLPFEILYDRGRLALHNMTPYTVPLNGLILQWPAEGEVYTAEQLGYLLPPNQCTWMRLLQEGALPPPSNCPNPAYRLSQIHPDTLYWAAGEDFTVLVNDEVVQVCSAAAGRCTFQFPNPAAGGAPAG